MHKAGRNVAEPAMGAEMPIRGHRTRLQLVLYATRRSPRQCLISNPRMGANRCDGACARKQRACGRLNTGAVVPPQLVCVGQDKLKSGQRRAARAGSNVHTCSGGQEITRNELLPLAASGRSIAHGDWPAGCACVARLARARVRGRNESELEWSVCAPADAFCQSSNVQPGRRRRRGLEVAGIEGAER